MKTRHPLSDDLDHILNHTESLFQSLNHKKIFLTGGTGFFGKWLLESFIWANKRSKLNAQIHVLSRDPEAFRIKCPHLADAEGVVLYRGDVRTFDFLEEQIDFVIHAATDARAQLNQENPLLMLDTIVDGTRRMLDFARHCEAKRFLLTSSGAVYGKQPPTLSHVPEDYTGAPDPSDPMSAYGEGKRLSELLCSIYQREYGIETTVARCFSFVGPYLPLNIHYAIGNFIRDALNGGPIQVNGDGTPYRSYLYAADLTIWLWTILFKGETCRAYNVGSEKGMTIAELASTVAECFQGPLEVRIAKTPDASGPAERYVPSTKRAREECGIRQIIDLKEGIRKTSMYNSQALPESQPLREKR